MPDEIDNAPETKKKKSQPNFLMTLIIVIVVALAISGITSFFIVKVLSSNLVESTKPSSQYSSKIPLRVILLQEGAKYPVMLKGGYDVAVIDSLQLDVGSTEARDAINAYRLEILEAIRMIFLNKTRNELSTPSGIELTKKQIINSVNEIIGFTGEREQLGVIKVTLIIMTITNAT